MSDKEPELHQEARQIIKDYGILANRMANLKSKGVISEIDIGVPLERLLIRAINTMTEFMHQAEEHNCKGNKKKKRKD